MFSSPEICSPVNLSKCKFAKASIATQSFSVLTAAAVCPVNGLFDIVGFVTVLHLLCFIY